jgi:hypothetical protein
VKSITFPSIGNHEYDDGASDGSGYFDYFGTRAGDRAKGYYSFDLGDWHLIALNSGDDSGGDCHPVSSSANSPQVTWLKADLAREYQEMRAAFWHIPRFSSGTVHGNTSGIGPIWDALYGQGRRHSQRPRSHLRAVRPPDTDRACDPINGLRQFVVGTGGEDLYTFGNPQANSVVRQNTAHGILKLTLKPDSYDWQFVPVQPSSFTDSGSGLCH